MCIRDRWNDRCAPGLEKNKNDQNNERDCFEKRFLNLVHGFANRNRWVIDNGVIESNRKALFELLHFFPDGIGRGKRIRTGQLENADCGSWLSPELAINGVVSRSQFHPSNVTNSGNLAGGTGLDHDIAELLFIRKSALGTDCVLECG